LQSDESTSSFSNRIFHMMKQALVENNHRAAFFHPGLGYSIDVSPSRLLFNSHVLRSGSEFTSLWQEE
jgi:hypothetical protein